MWSDSRTILQSAYIRICNNKLQAYAIFIKIHSDYIIFIRYIIYIYGGKEGYNPGQEYLIPLAFSECSPVSNLV